MRQTEDGNPKECGGVLSLLLGVKFKVFEKDAEHPAHLIRDDRLVNILGFCQSAKRLAVCIVVL